MILSKKMLSDKIGTWLFNHESELLGTMESLVLDHDSEKPAYLILKYGATEEKAGKRYYAISVHPSLVSVNQRDALIIHIDKEVLTKIMGIMADKVSLPLPDKPCVFELYKYSDSKF